MLNSRQAFKLLLAAVICSTAVMLWSRTTDGLEYVCAMMASVLVAANRKTRGPRD